VGDGDIPDNLTIACCKQAHDIEKPDLKMQMYETGAVRDTEIIVSRFDGSQRDCILTATARKDQNGNMLGVEGVLRDVTEIRIRERKERMQRKKLREEIILAEEKERRHIGQVLHEEMAQNLAVVNMKLQEAELQTCRHDIKEKQHPVCVQDKLQESRAMVKIMISQIRTMIFDLYPPILDDQGLVAAMNWYARNYTGKTGITVSVFGSEEDLGLSEPQAIYLFRAFKELLHNAWKHAGSDEVVATVSRRENHIRLTVDDAGKGFNPEKIHWLTNELQGIGLASIEQWISSLDGSMKIESDEGKGCRIILTIPIC
jgi:signal transduction histidine kinase